MASAVLSSVGHGRDGWPGQLKLSYLQGYCHVGSCFHPIIMVENFMFLVMILVAGARLLCWESVVHLYVDFFASSPQRPDKQWWLRHLSSSALGTHPQS